LEKVRYNISFASVSLLLEIVFVTVASVCLIRFLRSSPNNREAWLAVPFVLLSAAIVPTLLRKRNLSEIGFQIRQPKLLLRKLCGTCLVVFPALFGCVFLLRYYNFPLPLCPVIPEKRWPSWLVYQFMYVAVAEEAFFRGYLQSNVLCLLTTVVKKKLELLEWGSIIICAIVFAASHAVLLGNVISVITFFPGLILGWLFVKTKSLLAPILFHGLANVGYGFIEAALT